MEVTMRLAGGLVFIGMWLMAGHGAWGQEASSADGIVARLMEKNAERQRELESYTSERTYRVDYHGTGGEHYGELVVDVQYGEQGNKRLTVVSESGSKLICERVLRRMVETEQEASEKSNRMQMMLSPANYTFELLGQEVTSGVPSWVLQVSPKTENKLTYRGRIWVSEDDFAVVRVQGEPAKNPSWWINHASFDWQYEKHGKFWLPEKSVAVSHVRIGGEAKLTIEYGSYRVVAGPKINTGQVTTAQLTESRSAQ
jgi:hypothetical protein